MEPNTNPPPPNSSQGISNGSNQPINLIPYPKRLSKEELLKVYNALEKLKEQGTDPNHPLYVSLLKILKSQAYYYNFPQKSQQPPSSSVIPPNSSNGNPPPTVSNPFSPSPTTSHSISSPPNSYRTSTSAPSKSGIVIRFPGGLSLHPNQLLQLKAQILAYKYLSRNLPLPQRLLSALRSFSANRAQLQSVPISVIKTTPTISNPSVGTPTPSTSVQKPVSTAPTSTSTQKPVPLGTNLLNSTTTAPKSNGPVTNKPSPTPAIVSPPPPASLSPPGKPDSLPVSYLIQEREKRISARIANRIAELNKDFSFDISEELRRRILIEQKQLKLLETQKKLRFEIVQRMRKLTEIDAASLEASSFKKSRKTNKDKTITVLPSRVAVPKEANLDRHKEFLKAVLKHQEGFKQYHLNVLKTKKKLTKEISSYHSGEERKRQAEEERKKRERLEALRQNDGDAYKKLLQETKNERLFLLLKTTDQFMDKISSMIKDQKGRDEIEEKKKENQEKAKKLNSKRVFKEGDINSVDGEILEETEDMEEDSTTTNAEESINPDSNNSNKPSNQNTENEESVLEKNKRYYANAHTIEETTEQPQTLVGGKLKSYQLTGLQWLVSLYNNKLNGILADEMGLGKTIQTISLIAYLMEKKNNNGPYLVVAPLSTLSNWILEFSKWAPSINVVVYKGKPQVRKQIFRNEIMDCRFNVCLTSYEFVMIDKADLKKIEWDYIIIDEGHRIKNRNGKLSCDLKKYLSRHRLLLTGTPLQNDLNELWALLNFLLPTVFNSSKDFQGWFNAPFEYTKKSKKDSAEFIAPNEEETELVIHTLHKVLRPFLLRRLKKEVEHDLPDKVESVLKCELSALQKRMYKNMIEEGILYLDPDGQSSQKPKKTTKGFNNTLMQLQKICNHPYLFNEEYDVDRELIRASGKFDLLDRILPKLRATGHRILIFNQMTRIMDIMEEYFQMYGYKYLRLDGSTKAEDRADLVKIWNAPNSEHWLFILSTKAGGLGLNLQTADTVILFDTDWNPHMDLQAQDRVHRIGQEKEVRVFRLISHNTIEEKILEKAAFKKDVDAKVIQAGMFNTTANDNMRRELLRKLLEEDEDTEETQLVVSDEQINSIIARTDEELELFKQMDKERTEKDLSEWREQGRRGKPPPRLIQESELKSYLFQKKSNSEELESYGRGRRDRPEVIYDDNLTDFQFARMLEGKQVKRKRLIEDSPPPGESKLKKRKKNEKSDKPEKLDKLDKLKKKAQKKKKKDKKDKKDKKEKDEVSEEIDGNKALYDQILDILAGSKNPQGEDIGNSFIKLPSKLYYPDYYQVIKSPLSINKIRGLKFKSPEEFKLKVIQMLTNAHIYNQPGSFIYVAATDLMEIFKKEYQQRFGESEFQFLEPELEQ